MADIKRIHISGGGERGGFKISVGAIVFRAKSLIIEAAPCQPGTILWMNQASLEESGGMEIVWAGGVELAADNRTQDLVGFYVDKIGEQVGEDLVQYMADRAVELREN